MTQQAADLDHTLDVDPARDGRGDPSSRTTVLVLVVLAAVAFAASLLVQFHLVPLHSDNRDEGVYIFQALMLREGMITLPAEQYGEFFRPWLSGQIDGRIFTEYQVGFPLFLAAADLLLGSMRLGLALVAAAIVPAAYGFTRVLLGDRRTALWAAGLVVISPMTVLHSGLFLTYSLTVLLLLTGGWALLRAARERSWAHAVGGGLATGAALVVRPMDVVLFMVPIGALALWRLRGRPVRRAAGLVAVALAGVVPFGLLTLWYNSATTGSPLRFPNMAADELNTFGFGDRRLVETEPVVPYELSDAVEALWRNVVAVPSWLPGGIVLVAFAAAGAVLGGRRRGSVLDARVTLVAAVAAFPVGYLFWWATKLSAENALNGIGPHYYVPAMVLLCVLASRGAVQLLEQRPLAIAAACIVGVGLTVWALPDKVDDKRTFTRRAQQIEQSIPDDLDDAVVVVDYGGRPYVLSSFPFLVNDPRLQGDVLYAADRGARNVALFDLFPDRDVYHVRSELEPGDELFVPSARFDPLTRERGDVVTFTVDPVDLPPGRPARAFITVGGRTEYRDLGTTDDALRTTEWHIAAPDAGVGHGAIEVDRDTEVLVGVETAMGDDFSVSERLAERHSVAVRDGSLVLLSPGRGIALARFAAVPLELAQNVSHQVRIDAEVVTGAG